MKFFLNYLLHRFNYKLIKQENFFEKKKKIFKSLINLNSPLIIDIGAHKGETILEMKKIFPSSQIHSFEPDPQTFSLLKKNTKKIKNIFLNNSAISNKNSNKLKFYRHEFSKLNSFKKINIKGDVIKQYLSFHKNKNKNKIYNKPIYVKSLKLDSYCKKSDIKKIDILKIDVQSSEKECLRGSLKILKNTNVIYTEINFHDMYETSYNFYDLESIIVPMGFSLFCLVKSNKQKNSERLGWVEAVYIKEK